MNFKRTAKGGLLFQLEEPERVILLDCLNLYPVVPVAHHRLTKAVDAQSDDNQRLLDEALAEQRVENKRQLEALINVPERWEKVDKGLQLRLNAGEVEWLLQVFNDIRVGSWLLLGEPDEDNPPEVSPDNFRYTMAMEIAGLFQTVMLAALGDRESSRWHGET